MGRRTIFGTTTVITIMSALLATASAQTSQTMSPRSGTHLGKDLPPQRQALGDEHIVMPKFPGGWVAQPAREGSIEVVEYLPKGQTMTDWREKITLEIHHDSNTLPLDAFQRRALGQMRENCDGVIEGRLQTGLNNGFPSAFWNLGCKRNKKANYGETRYTKGVQGTNTLYLLSHTWRTASFSNATPPITPAQVADVVAFLTSSVVCGNGTQHPCPVGNAAPK